MNIGQELLNIISRHESRTKACGDKLMNAERDLTKVLDILDSKFVPILSAALQVHKVSEMDDTETEMRLAILFDRLADMSTALYEAGMVALPSGKTESRLGETVQ